MTETPRWIASSYSGGDGGQCVEWAPAHALATGEFLVRDSKVQNGPHLTLSRESFAGLVALARARG
ncbi:DUF397 domain-containing protein [Streptomyces albidoflavus]|uniref:DUF397 domain-containing protein n=1 Tax=Streptomyces TaxID=1883 RepID=UPI0002830DF1|nr:MULTISPECIES: DUF397 domain-containing protein [Streptomyces]NEC97325.1 DUF397 domain-containing protein [Streptomyces albidoflavus]PKA38455.1 DUF397 domain-containing protein [Streptomyces sp. SM8]WTB63760.1 DUF397 domain-containing protein [Streptomyces albidoflavus]